MDEDGANSGSSDTVPGLRDRKKARRRQDIMDAARQLFAQNGFDATTIAHIAEAVEVSQPTVFNYFGSKDGILIALITEGTARARRTHQGLSPRTDTDFAGILTDLFTDVSRRTLEIAGKRVWRYAEAATIRHPSTELARQYVTVDDELLRVIVRYVAQYDLRLRSGRPADQEDIARLFFDVWNTTYLTLIRDESCTLARHRADIEARFRPLCEMLFEDDFLQTPRLNSKGTQEWPRPTS